MNANKRATTKITLELGILNKIYIPYMQANMHCKVEGKLFAAVTDRQNTDISLTLIAGFPGPTLASMGICSAPTVPAQQRLTYI